MPDRRPQRLGDEVGRRLFPTPDPHVGDPVGWIEERLGPLWSGQRRIVQAVLTIVT